MTAPTLPRLNRRSIIQAALGLAVAVVMLWWGLPHFAKTSWTDIGQQLGKVPLSHILGYQVLMLVGLWCYTFTFTGSLPGLPHWKALTVNLCGSSVSNLLPGGGAVGLAATYAILRSWGFTHRATSTSAIVTGVWNVLARIALPVVAICVLWYGNTGVSKTLTDLAISGATTGVIILALFIAILASERAAQGIGRVLDKLLSPLLRRNKRTRAMSIDVLVHDLRLRINDVVRRGWGQMTFGMVGFFGMYYALFVLVMRGTNVALPLGILFAAFAIGRLLTAVGITPGGLGVTETVTAAALVAWGADSASATAGVLLFSLFTHLMEIPLGGLGWLVWSLSSKKEPPPEGTEPAV